MLRVAGSLENRPKNSSKKKETEGGGHVTSNKGRRILQGLEHMPESIEGETD